jgi:transcriptional regulator with XRE-family HTH domain
MKDDAGDINKRIANRVRELRSRCRFSLDDLAERSGVSRSMISVIERGESSPTAALLEKLTRALGVPLASLFDAPKTARRNAVEPLMRHADQPVWKDPDTGYIRRNISPPEVPQRIRIVEVQFPAGSRISFEPAPGQRPFHQQIWLLEGVMDIRLGPARYQMQKGDCLAVRMDQITMFFNPGTKASRYAIVTVSDRKAARL